MAELHKAEPKILPMEYRSMRAAMPLGQVINTSAFAAKEPVEEPASVLKEENLQLAARVQELERQISEREEVWAHQLAAAQKESFERGIQEADARHTRETGRMLESLRRAIDDFRATRDAYMGQVEQDVVRLALEIAARILRREAQMDPLLLTGAVRVALGQLSDTTEVRLHVPAAEYDLWSDMVRLLPNLPLHPQVVADEMLRAGECTLETHLGSVELGVKAQLEEIERGFFDLLERRGGDIPAPGSRNGHKDFLQETS